MREMMPKVALRMRIMAKDILLKKISLADAIVELMRRGETTASIETGFNYWGIKI